MPIPLGILAVAGAGAGAAGAYDLLETTVLGTAAATVTFSSLGSYSDYKHLQVRMVTRSVRDDSALETVNLRVNGDSGSNYAFHTLFGNGSSVTSSASTSQTKMQLTFNPINSTTTVFNPAIIDILDFSNASKNTTFRSLTGIYIDGSTRRIDLRSGFWNNTAAVTSLTFTDDGGQNFSIGSRFSLYGIR